MDVTICVFVISLLYVGAIKFNGCRLMVDGLMKFCAAKMVLF